MSKAGEMKQKGNKSLTQKKSKPLSPAAVHTVSGVLMVISERLLIQLIVRVPGTGLHLMVLTLSVLCPQVTTQSSPTPSDVWDGQHNESHIQLRLHGNMPVRV